MKLSIDIGGSFIKAAIVDLKDKKILNEKKIPTFSHSDKALENLFNIISEELITEVDSICIAFAGQIDNKTGYVIYSPNLFFSDLPLKSLLEEKFKKRVYIDNDVNAAAWGEYKFGAGKGFSNIVTIFVGTGIGGAIISNGNLVRGKKNAAGEIGHICVKKGGEKCFMSLRRTGGLQRIF